MRPTVVMSFVGLGLLLAIVAAQATYAADDAPEAAMKPEQLVDQLGSESYLKRERARKELERREEAAREALEAGLKSGDLEVQYHCERLLVDIRDRATERLLTEFIKDPDPKKEYDFPAWKQAREILGDTADVRALYVEMYRAEPAILRAVDDKPEEASGKISQRVIIVQQNINSFNTPVTIGSISAFLLAGSSEKVSLAVNANSQIFSLCYQPVFRENIGSATRGPAMKKLIGRFMLKAEDHSAYQGLMLAMQLDLKDEGLQAATKLLSNKGVAPHVKQYALLAVAKMGTAEHLGLLAESLEDKTICSQQQINKVMYQTQLRDVAVFSMVHLSKQDVKEFGFDRFSPNPQMLANVYSLGFENDEKRQATFDKWKKFSDEQKAKAAAEKK